MAKAQASSAQGGGILFTSLGPALDEMVFVSAHFKHHFKRRSLEKAWHPGRRAEQGHGRNGPGAHGQPRPALCPQAQTGVCGMSWGPPRLAGKAGEHWHSPRLQGLGVEG